MTQSPDLVDRVLLLTASSLTEQHVAAIQAALVPLGWQVRRERVTSLSELDSVVTTHDPVALVGDRLPDLDAAGRPQLRWVQLSTAGIDQELGSQAWLDDAVAVTTASGLAGVSMAQYVVLAILHHVQRFSLLGEFRETRAWTMRPRFRARVLTDLTVGFLGYGASARRAASICAAMGMRCLATRRDAVTPVGRLAFDPRPLGSGPDLTLVRGPASLKEMLQESDFVVVTLPLTPATRQLMDAQAFSACRPGAVLVNVSRGGVIDQAALVAALESGHLGGAILDVFEHEPLSPDDPLWTTPNVTLTPHVSGVHDRIGDFLAPLVIDNATRFVEGRPLFNEASRDHGY